MDANRQADELASRCVALVIYHQYARTTRPGRPAIDADFKAVVAEAIEGRISPTDISAQVRSVLDARYDSKTARRLHDEFVAGFADTFRSELMRM
jgi:hypothetical protein